MVTMEGGVKDLLEAGIIDMDEARRAILEATDEEDESTDGDSGYASASLGGGKMNLDTMGAGNKPSKQGNNDDGYSF